jgi:antitoxin component HigA of HigAB toxin-antitoxin module
MVINTVSYRGMDSNYTKKEVSDGRIIVEYSLPVSICATDTEEFLEEFEAIQAEKKARTPVISSGYGRPYRTQQEIPFENKHLKTLNQYNLGTLNFKIATLKDVLAEIKNEDHLDSYLDEVEKICMDYVDNYKAKEAKKAIFDLMNTFEEMSPNHKFMTQLTFNLGVIHSMIEDVEAMNDDLDSIPFGKKGSTKDISRMTDREWQEYIKYKP